MEQKDSLQTQPTYDTFHMGRSRMDLYSSDVGVDFVDIKSFAAYVGESPTNMSVGCRRLGLKSASLTAFGEDPVGDFVVHFLKKEGVDVQFSPRKPDRYTSLVVLGIQPPDKFPLVFYRDNCADIALDIDHVLAAPGGFFPILFRQFILKEYYENNHLREPSIMRMESRSQESKSRRRKGYFPNPYFWRLNSKFWILDFQTN